jgi:hypothetical protein
MGETKRRLVVALVVALGITTAAAGPAAGTHTKYPDLKSLKPINLGFDRVGWSDGTTHWVLRFDNTVWNAGEGRLELEGQKRGKIYQRLYDAAVGGSVVQRIYIGNDALFHEGHNHWHFANFASYLLLKRDANGVYQPTTKKGTKTSFCVMDSRRVGGSYGRQYTTCGQALQGLTVGWGDTYAAHLPEQWIDLGSSRLAAGTYAVQTTADPANQLDEGGRDANNTATTCFRVGSTNAITLIAC